MVGLNLEQSKKVLYAEMNDMLTLAVEQNCQEELINHIVGLGEVEEQHLEFVMLKNPSALAIDIELKRQLDELPESSRFIVNGKEHKLNTVEDGDIVRFSYVYKRDLLRMNYSNTVADLLKLKRIRRLTGSAWIENMLALLKKQEVDGKVIITTLNRYLNMHIE